MTVYRCPDCNTYTEWLRTRFGGKKILFEYPPISKEDVDPNDGWIPGDWTVNGRLSSVLAPLSHYRLMTRERTRRVLRQHTKERCGELARVRAAATRKLARSK